MSLESKIGDPRYEIADAIAKAPPEISLPAITRHLASFVPISVDTQNNQPATNNETGQNPPLAELFPEYRAMGQAVRLFLLYQELEGNKSQTDRGPIGFQTSQPVSVVATSEPTCPLSTLPERYITDFQFSAQDHIREIWTDVVRQVEQRRFQGCFWGTLSLLQQLPNISPAMILDNLTQSLEAMRRNRT